jgi:hypothetical protein
MARRAVIWFVTLKGLKSKAIPNEHMSVHGEDSFPLPAVKQANKRFREGRTDFIDDPRTGRPLTHQLSETLRLYLMSAHLFHGQFFARISG